MKKGQVVTYKEALHHAPRGPEALRLGPCPLAECQSYGGPVVALLGAYNVGVDGVVHKCPKLMPAHDDGDTEEAARPVLM